MNKYFIEEQTPEINYFEYIEADFTNNLFLYMANLDIRAYLNTLISNIKTTIDYIEENRELNCEKILDNVNKKYISMFESKSELTFQNFLLILHNIPAFMPLVIIILKTNIYLNKIANRTCFIESIKFEINKTNLLKELWEKNLEIGSFFEDCYEDVYPTITRQWEKYPNIHKKCKIFAYLYLAIEKAIYLPIEKMEDRLIMDMNTLLDTYFFTEEDKTSYDFCGGPRMIPNASDKLNSIMQGNVLKPDKYKKKEKELHAYIDGFTDYNTYKTWYKRLKYIFQYWNCENKPLKKFKKLNLDSSELELFNLDYKYFVQTKQKPNIFKYLFQSDEELARIISYNLKIKTKEKLEKWITNTTSKNFALTIIKSKYPILSKKSNKRIQNKFTEFSTLVNEICIVDSVYSVREQLIEIYDQYENNNRYWELDDKEFEDIKLKIIESEEILLPIKKLYYLYEQYTYTPSKYLYNALIKQIKELKKLSK